MGFAVKSPAPLALEDLTLIDLQLFSFGPFDVKTEESYASESAQAVEAPEDDGGGAAQDEDDEPQEPYNQDEGDNEGGVDPESDPEDESADEDAQTESGAQANPTAPSQDEWVVPGKFRTWDDVLKAQQEAERQLGRLHREVAEQRRQASQPPPPEQKPPEPEKTPEQIAQENRERLQRFIKNPIEYERELIRQAEEAALQRIQQANERDSARTNTVMQGISIAASKYADFAEVEAAVGSILGTRPVFQRALQTLRDDPNATPDDFASLVEDAYQVAKAELAHVSVQAARDQGRQEATAAQAQRRKAAVVGQGTRRDQTQETAEERIKREIKDSGRSTGIWKI